MALITDALPRGPTGPYQLQAAIAAIHDEVPGAEDTDWPQILALYDLLMRISDNPVVALNRGSRWPWSEVRERGSTSSKTSRPTSGSPRTTGSMPFERTCWRWPGRLRRPETPTSPRPRER